MASWPHQGLGMSNSYSTCRDQPVNYVRYAFNHDLNRHGLVDVNGE
jgi:hypothetical protein